MMTLLLLFSIKPLRQHHYEAFYFLHILFVPLTLIMSALHHPPLMWWCVAASGLWVGERFWRFIRWVRINGFLGSSQVSLSSNRGHAIPFPPTLPSTGQQTSTKQDASLSKFAASTPDLPQALTFGYPPSAINGPSHSSTCIAPPGFARVELLPGRTVRLRIVTPGSFPWAPGQHFLISVPSVSRFTTHPFTVASVYDEQSPTHVRELVFLIRAKNGWTKDLWDVVAFMISHGQTHLPSEKLPAHCELPSRGALLRAFVDGPFGSAARARWGSHSSVLIVAGGSGVSFGLSVLQYLCACMSGRDGRKLGGQSGGRGQPGFRTSRVRFVWLAREFCEYPSCGRCFLYKVLQIPNQLISFLLFSHKVIFSGALPFSGDV